MEQSLWSDEISEEEIEMFFYDSDAAVEENATTDLPSYTLVPEAPGDAWLQLLGHSYMFMVIVRPVQWILNNGTVTMITLRIDIFAL